FVLFCCKISIRIIFAFHLFHLSSEIFEFDTMTESVFGFETNVIYPFFTICFESPKNSQISKAIESQKGIFEKFSYFDNNFQEINIHNLDFDELIIGSAICVTPRYPNKG